ncbi:MAG TPA: S41 family peptidase [Roseiflexaceae bacterium]|nr:S41 family peptidase [Roseiflexaceae bacterium]
MTTTYQIFKRGMMVVALLGLGFVGGWFSAIILGGRIPISGDIAAYLGPGRGANQATPQQLRDQFGVFWEVWNLVENEFYHRQPIDRTRMIRGAISGMLASLDDQYTVYQEPDLASQTADHMQGTLEGIGAYIRVADGKAYIDKVFKDSPAQAAALQQDDEIVQVDGVDIPALIAGLDLNQAAVKVAAKIRGPRGTTVNLTLRREVGGPTFNVAIVRAQVIVGSINSQMLDGGLAYIRIGEFKATTTRELDTALRELLPQRPKGLILDLRNNPGGFLVNAQDVLGRFYEGVALYEEDGAGQLQELRVNVGPRDVRAFDLPLVVLVNGGSASASEIVAGALRDSRAATYLIGEKTYGKGSVQNIHTLSDGGSARITIAHWLTPHHEAIHKIGITPQYVVPYAEDASSPTPCVADRRPPAGQTTCADTQLAAAIRLLATGQVPAPTTPTAAK